MKLRILGLMLGTIALAGMFAACGSTTSNVNVNVAGRNAAANNSNVAVLVNNNSNMVTGTNRWSNSNVSRADYDKSRADYEKDKGASTIGSGANDSWLWFKTRAALMTTNDIGESGINVDVVNDVVTLKGEVETAAEKTKAGQVAKEIDGVKSVKNELKVVPDGATTNTNAMNKR